MCDCTCKGAVSSKGPKGNPGVDGKNAVFGGYSDKWKLNTSNGTNPAALYMKTDNNTANLVDYIYLNKTDANSVIVSDFLASFNNSGTYGKVRIFKEYDSSIFAIYEVIGLALAGNVTALHVVWIDGSIGDFTTSNTNGTSLNDVEMVVSFTPNAVITGDGESTTNLNLIPDDTTMAKINATETGTLVAGTYLFSADFTAWNLGAADVTLEYQFYRSTSAVGTKRTISFLTANQGEKRSFSINEKIVLTGSFKVSLWMKQTGDVSGIRILSQSVQYIKL